MRSTVGVFRVCNKYSRATRNVLFIVKNLKQQINLWYFYQIAFFSEVLKPVNLENLEPTTKLAQKPKPQFEGVISKSVLIGYSNADKLTIFSSFTGDDGTTVILSSYGYLK